jgi:hypothetical protein
MSDERKRIKKRIKKLQLKFELCLLELEDAEELDRTYAEEFAKDFRHELTFLQRKKEEKAKLDEKNDRKKNQKAKVDATVQTIKPPIQENEGLKRLHKQLAFELHPDRGKRQNHDDFIELQSAWDNQDYDRMIGISMKMQMDLSETLDEESVMLLEKKLVDREKSLQRIKRNARWIWSESNKNEKLKLFIRKSMGINEREFQSWSLQQDQNEKECKETPIERKPINEIGSEGSARKILP